MYQRNCLIWVHFPDDTHIPVNRSSSHSPSGDVVVPATTLMSCFQCCWSEYLKHYSCSDRGSTSAGHRYLNTDIRITIFPFWYDTGFDMYRDTPDFFSHTFLIIMLVLSSAHIINKYQDNTNKLPWLQRRRKHDG